MPNVENLTTKQFGDACEYATLAELGFAGQAAVKMPDANPGYDLVLVDKSRARISVRGLRAGPRSGGGRKLAGFWILHPDNFDWLVLIRVHSETASGTPTCCRKRRPSPYPSRVGTESGE
jgi:hypothetical protein